MARAVISLDSKHIHHPNEFRAQVLIDFPATGATHADHLVLNLYDLQMPGLSLEVQDENREEVLRLPPPVPDPAKREAQRRLLQPGETRSLVYDHLDIDPAFLPAGQYRVRFRTEVLMVSGSATQSRPLASEWVDFRVD